MDGPGFKKNTHLRLWNYGYYDVYGKVNKNGIVLVGPISLGINLPHFGGATVAGGGTR